MYKIYKLTTPTGKVYIGQTKQDNLERRCGYGSGYVNNKPFYKEITEYGWNSITKEILEEVESKSEAIERERYYILKFNSYLPEYGFNKHTNLNRDEMKRPYIRCVETDKVYESMVIVAEKIGVTKSAVSFAIKNNKPCKGRYYERVYMTREEYKASNI